MRLSIKRFWVRFSDCEKVLLDFSSKKIPITARDLEIGYFLSPSLVEHVKPWVPVVKHICGKRYSEVILILEKALRPLER